MKSSILPHAFRMNNDSLKYESELHIEAPENQEREFWLDGLRGVAATIVAWFHFSASFLDLPYRSFWDEPAEQNRRIIQLPLFRLWISGPSMVNIFFVLSGYSISISLLRFREKANKSTFYRKLSSAVFRRPIRLYIPVLFTLVISHTLHYTGFNRVNEGESQGCPDAQPLSHVWPHVQCLQSSLLSTMNLAGPFTTMALNVQIWTISPEFYCSLWTYLIIAGLANVKSTIRVIILTTLCFSLLYYGKIMFSGFLAGLLFAELDLMGRKGKLSSKSVPSSRTRMPLLTACRRVSPVIFLSIGIYLIGLPVKHAWQFAYPPDFNFQSHLELPYWSNRDERIRGWLMLGAILTIGSLRKLPLLKALFETNVAQFLGRISFSLYLIHPLFFHMFRESVLSSITLVWWGKDFWHTKNDDGSELVLAVAWLAGVVTVAPILVFTSIYVTKHVDQRAISLAHKFERTICKD